MTMSKHAMLVVLAIALVMLTALTAQAASFDCSKAQERDERAICNSPELSSLDSEMGGLWFAYRRVPMLMGSSGARRDDADQFLEQRRLCGADPSCLRRIYQDRIQSLKAGVVQTMNDVLREENDGSPVSSLFMSVLPKQVEHIIAEYVTQCHALGGRLAVGANRPQIMSADLDGDGKPDYVLNPQGLQCSAAATAFCANEGCQISIALSGNEYQNPVAVLGGQPTLTQRQQGISLDVRVDRSKCRLSDHRSACWVTYAWEAGKMHISYAIRSAAE